MSKTAKKVIEFRSYNLQPDFPVLLLTGEAWHISDVPAGRLHFHNCLEIGFCESDSGTIEFMDKTVPFHAGDITLIASDVFHTTYSDPGTSSKWSYLFIDVEELLYPYFPVQLLSHRESLHEILHSKSAVFPEEEYPLIHYLIRSVIELLVHKEENYRLAVACQILTFLIQIINLYHSSDKDELFSAQPYESTISITPALEFIRKSYMQEFSINDLADLCKMSPTHFRRTFTSVMGTGAQEYLIKTRIQQASVLLRTTDLPILQISEEVGFHSLSSFNRHFSHLVGEPPREWRKHMSYKYKLSIVKDTGWMVPPQYHEGKKN